MFSLLERCKSHIKKITPSVSLLVKAIYVLGYFDLLKTDVNQDLRCWRST